MVKRPSTDSQSPSVRTVRCISSRQSVVDKDDLDNTALSFSLLPGSCFFPLLPIEVSANACLASAQDITIPPLHGKMSREANPSLSCWENAWIWVHCCVISRYGCSA